MISYKNYIYQQTKKLPPADNGGSFFEVIKHRKLQCGAQGF